MAKETFSRDKPHLVKPPPPDNNVTGVTVVLTAGVITQFDIDFNGSDYTGYVWLIQMAPIVGSGITTLSPSRFKLICTAENVLLSGTLDLIVPVQTRFGNLQVGAKVFVRLFMVDSVSGQKWDMGQQTTIITGT